MQNQYNHFNPVAHNLDVKIATVRTGSHCKHNINYHIIWIPKYRKKLLYGKVKEVLNQIIRGQCQDMVKKKFQMLVKFPETTKEIIDDYNHKAPDSLLCGDEVWFLSDYVDDFKVSFLKKSKGLFSKSGKSFFDDGVANAQLIFLEEFDRFFLSPKKKDEAKK